MIQHEDAVRVEFSIPKILKIICCSFRNVRTSSIVPLGVLEFKQLDFNGIIEIDLYELNMICEKIKHFVRQAHGLYVNDNCEFKWTPTAYSNLTADVIILS